MYAVDLGYNEIKKMIRQLNVDLLKPEAKENFGQIKGAKTYIGREPEEEGIAMPFQGVSRNHGIFARLRTHWFYKDLDSTNGSWINGRKLDSGEWKLVRPGDVIQMADSAIRLSSDSESTQSQSHFSGFPALGGVTLIVFSKGEFIDEFPVPDFGRALVIGGSQGDLQIEGTLEEAPNLIIERRSMNVCAYGISKSIHIVHNGAELSGNVNLNDRDEIKVGHFYIIFNSPSNTGKGFNAVSQSQEYSGQGAAWKEWSNADKGPDLRTSEMQVPDHTRPETKGLFGRSDNESMGIDETISISAEEAENQIAGFERHPSMRYMIEEEEPQQNNLGNLDEKIIFVIGIVLLLALIGLMIYWLLS